jgi:SAM-dependent methyltransferase
LPYEDNTFDYIVSVETIEHIENPNKLINNFHRILVPGGELILTTPNICNISSRALFLMKCDFHRFGDYEDHISPLPWFILKRLLENNGFEIDSIFTNKFVRPRKSIIFYLLFPFYSNKDPILQFGDILIIKAKKVKM